MPKKTMRTLVLRSKGEITRFQVLLEVMRTQPHVKQKDVSDKLGITIQAVNKYFKKLTREGLLEIGSERASYRLTPKATAKLREDVRNLEEYIISIRHEMKIERAVPVIASQPVEAGEEVGIILKEGVMYSTSPNDPATEAKGTVMASASPGEDVGLHNLRGKVKLKQGRILIIRLPSIRQGGSRSVDLVKVKAYYDDFKPDRVGVMGAVGRAVLNKLGLRADLEFGISNAAAIAASRGLSVFVLVVGRMVNRMIEEIDSINVKSVTEVIYEVKDGRMPKPKS